MSEKLVLDFLEKAENLKFKHTTHTAYEEFKSFVEKSSKIF